MLSVGHRSYFSSLTRLSVCRAACAALVCCVYIQNQFWCSVRIFGGGWDTQIHSCSTDWCRPGIGGREGGGRLELFQKFQSVSLGSSAGWDVRNIALALQLLQNIIILTDIQQGLPMNTSLQSERINSNQA